MARAKRITVSFDPTNRDFVMARLAAAQTSAKAAIDAIDEALALFVNPDDDGSGKERKELVDNVLESLGCATRAAESAEEALPHADPKEVEPWDEDDGDEEEEDDDEA